MEEIDHFYLLIRNNCYTRLLFTTILTHIFKGDLKILIGKQFYFQQKLNKCEKFIISNLTQVYLYKYSLKVLGPCFNKFL